MYILPRFHGTLLIEAYSHVMKKEFSTHYPKVIDGRLKTNEWRSSG